mmetsp:Transcript_51241/g.147122  ORF Transcript_51241/g.147122 Transcript_51241/m.147122 type:complete len:225 (+) Transcript_51241:1474-2148(+)
MRQGLSGEGKRRHESRHEPAHHLLGQRGSDHGLDGRPTLRQRHLLRERCGRRCHQRHPGAAGHNRRQAAGLGRRRPQGHPLRHGTAPRCGTGRREVRRAQRTGHRRVEWRPALRQSDVACRDARALGRDQKVAGSLLGRPAQDPMRGRHRGSLRCLHPGCGDQLGRDLNEVLPAGVACAREAVVAGAHCLLRRYCIADRHVGHSCRAAHSQVCPRWQPGDADEA